MLAICEIARIENSNIRLKAVQPISLNLTADLMEIAIFDPREGYIGKIRELLLNAWNQGDLPVEEGSHPDVAFVRNPVQIMYAEELVECNLTATLTVKYQRFFGELSEAQLASINGEGPDVPMPDLDQDWRELAAGESPAVDFVFQGVKQYEV